MCSISFTGVVKFSDDTCMDFNQLSETGVYVQSFPGDVHVDDLIRALENIGMCILQTEPGTCGVPRRTRQVTSEFFT